MFKETEVKVLRECHGLLCSLESAGIEIVINTLVNFFKNNRIPGTDNFLRGPSKSQIPTQEPVSEEIRNG